MLSSTSDNRPMFCWNCWNCLASEAASSKLRAPLRVKRSPLDFVFSFPRKVPNLSSCKISKKRSGKHSIKSRNTFNQIQEHIQSNSGTPVSIKFWNTFYQIKEHIQSNSWKQSIILKTIVVLLYHIYLQINRVVLFANRLTKLMFTVP